MFFSYFVEGSWRKNPTPLNFTKKKKQKPREDSQNRSHASEIPKKKIWTRKSMSGTQTPPPPNKKKENQKKNDTQTLTTRWFKVTFWFPSWRSLSPLKGHLTIPKRSLWITRHTTSKSWRSLEPLPTIPSLERLSRYPAARLASGLVASSSEVGTKSGHWMGPIFGRGGSSCPKKTNTLPETNSKLAPENGWLEYDPYLLGFGLFSGANLLLVLGRVIIQIRGHEISWFFFWGGRG